MGNPDRGLGNLHLAVVADKEVAKGPARRRTPDLKSRSDAAQAAAAEGEKAAISAWVAEEYNRALGQEPTRRNSSFLSGRKIGGAI